MGLEEASNRLVRTYSGGMIRRLEIAQSALHRPQLLFLDEPTIGLDVVAKERIRQFILHMNRERGVTVLLTTHDLSDVERLCERVMILDHGRVLFDGKLSSLNERFESDWFLVVRFAGEYEDVCLPGLPQPSREDHTAVYRFDHRKVSSAELIQQLLPRFHIDDIEVRRPAVEETVRRIYEERLLIDPSEEPALQ
jgi:ABC-2 type transport system ATP-binding protein